MNIFIESALSKYYQKYPLVLADIGASGGLEPHWAPAKKYLQIIGFEPNEKEFSNLKKKENRNVTYLNTGLYNKNTFLDYYVTKNPQNSSVFKPNKKFLNQFSEKERFDIIKVTKIETDTLDNQFKTHNITDTDFIKIDTQGSELFILEGAAATIQNFVFGIEVEVEFVEQYRNQPLFADVDSFIRKQGFWMFDIQSCHWKRIKGKDCFKKRGQMVFGNALYLKKSENFIKMIETIQNKTEKKSKILRALSICFLYGYFDYAREIFDMTSALFNEAERRGIEKKFKHSIRWANKIPNFRGQRMLAEMVRSVWEFVRPTHDGWATIDRKLGNV